MNRRLPPSAGLAWRAIGQTIRLIALVAAGIGFAAALGSRIEAAEEQKLPPAGESISYFREVRPIFQTHCQGCHQPAKPMGDLVMTHFEGLLKGGESGEPAIVPGKPAASKLVAQITPDGGKAEMPKDKPPLSETDIQLISRWIAAGAKDDTPPSVRAVIDSEHPPTYEGPPVITSLSFSPDDTLLAVSGYHEVLLFQADGSQLVARLVGQSERIESAVFSPDGKSLAVTGGSPGRLGEVQVWDVAERKLRLAVPVTYDTVYGASWSADNTKIAFGCADNTVRAIDAASGAQLLYQGAHADWVLDTVFSKDSSYVISVSRDRSMKLIEVATQRFVDNITSITPGALKGGLEAVDRHPQKDELLLGGADGVPKIYKMIRTQARQIGDDFNLLKAYEAVPGRIYDVAFNPDGSRFAVGSSLDGTGEVRIYETESGKLLHKLPQQGAIFAVTFSASGKVMAAAGFDGVVRLIDADTGSLVKQFAPAPLAPGKVAAEK
jgi:dipeptidyl aminopeptidase/acylaminoacyl peptidase